MAKQFKEYTFADGHRCCCRGMSKLELRVEENKHGKLISIAKCA